MICPSSDRMLNWGSSALLESPFHLPRRGLILHIVLVRIRSSACSYCHAADAPDKGSSPKPAAPKKAPLLPPGFDFVRLPNGELKLVPQLGIQAQRRRETNAASKLIVSASKEARRLVRDVRNEHRLAGGRHKNVQSPAKGQQPGGSSMPPILQNTSTSTRIAALRALEALGSINLNPNPAVRFTPPLKESQAQLGDIGDPWGPQANGGGQAPASIPQPPLPRPALARELPSTAVAPKAGEPLRKKPRFKAPGATVFKAAPTMPPPSKPPASPPEPSSPSLLGNMLWIPSEEVVPRTKPSGRRKASSSSVWRLYGILPNQVRSTEQQAYAAPPAAKKQKKGGAEAPAAIPLVMEVSATPPFPVPAPVSGPPRPPAVDSGAPTSSEGTIPEEQATAGTEELPAGGEDANAELPSLPATPAAPHVQPPGAEPSATDSPESDLPIAFLQPLLETPAAAPTTEPVARIPPPPADETLELDLEEDSFGAQESAEAPSDIVPKPANDVPPRDPTVPLEGVYNFAFVADPSLPGVAVELPPGTLRKDGTLRDRAAALKYPSRVQDAAPRADVRRLAVDVSTGEDAQQACCRLDCDERVCSLRGIALRLGGGDDALGVEAFSVMWHLAPSVQLERAN
jgi:hypothetical protein